LALAAEEIAYVPKTFLSKIINMTKEEEEGVDGCNGKLAMSIPPYLPRSWDPDDPKCPIRLQCVPQVHEFKKFFQ